MPLVPMRAGDFSTPMELQVPLRAENCQDSSGQPIPTWATVRMLNCDFEPITDPSRGSAFHRTKTGSENSYGGQQRAEVVHLIRCRGQDFTITPDMRLVYNSSDIYNLTEGVNIQKHAAEVRMMATENVSFADDADADYIVVATSSGLLIRDSVGNLVVVSKP